jgi:AcrR family transcriptional regulator
MSKIKKTQKIVKPKTPSPQVLQVVRDYIPRKGEAKQLVIVEAAIKCLGKDGILRLSYDQLSSMTQMRRSHINYYFPSFDHLIESCFKYITASLQEATVQALSLKPTGKKTPLMVYVETTLEWFNKNQDHFNVLLLISHLTTCDPRYRDIYQTVKKVAEARVVNLLRDSGVVGTNRELEVSAARIRNYLIGEMVDYFSCVRHETFSACLSRVRKGVGQLIT